MFERFTERAKQVVVLAQVEARYLKHDYIGTEHLLLGVLREERGIGAHVLDDLGVTLDEVRVQVGSIVGTGDEVTTGQIPFTPSAKKVLELALREAQALGSGHIGTEHILLGVAREREGVGARILLDRDVDGTMIRRRVFEMLGGKTRFSRGTLEEPLSPQLNNADRFRAFEFIQGWALFGISLGLGVLIGWAIWGL